MGCRRAAIVPLAAALCGFPLAAQAQQDSDSPVAAPAQQLDDDAFLNASLDPDSDMAPLPDLGVDWPDLDAPLPAEPVLTSPDLSDLDFSDAGDAAAGDAASDGDGLPGEVASGDALAQDDIADDPAFGVQTQPLLAADRSDDPRDRDGLAATARPIVGDGPFAYSVRLSGIPDAASDRLDERFDALSTLRNNDEDATFAAQIARRASDDADLLQNLLRIEGYYDALTYSELLGAGQNRIEVMLDVEPGSLYRFSRVALPGIDAAGVDSGRLRSAFDLDEGDPVNQDAVVAARTGLVGVAAESGYPFFETGEPDLVVDRAADSGTLDLPVTPGGRFVFGRIVPRKNDLFGARHLGRIARFDPGDLFRRSDVEDLNSALIATGLVSRVTIDPVTSDRPGEVDLAVDIEPAPPRTIAGEIGYGTGEGFRVEASWEHRNFFPPEGALRLAGVAGTREQLVSATYRRNNFLGRDRVLSARVLARSAQLDAFEAKTLSISANYERLTTLIFQKRWTWFAGPELLYTQERAYNIALGARDQQTFYIGAFPSGLFYDGTDNLLDPTRGFRLGATLSPEISFLGTADGYARSQIDASVYQPVTDRVVLAGRARFGAISGTGLGSIAPSRRNYAGGGGSVRGYGYQRIGPRDPNGDPIGGRGLSEFSLEARFRFGAFGVVPFVDAGSVTADQFPDLSDLQFGAGIGLRYYSDFGPIRIDVGTPLNPGPGDGPIAVAVSLGQAF